MPSTPLVSLRALRHVKLAAGVPVILVGFACFLISDLFDGGFLRGLFQGATAASMVLGAYLIGTAVWHRKRDEQDLDQGAQWLPSRDSAHPPTEHAPGGEVPDRGTD